MMFPEPQELISDEEIKRVAGFANFGTQSYRYVVNEGLLKCASGYHNGGSVQTILHDLGLIKAAVRTGSKTLTAKGKKYLFAAYHK